jgi:hypothetical protein
MWVRCLVGLLVGIHVFFNRFVVMLVFSRSLSKLIYTNNIESNVNINCLYRILLIDQIEDIKS